MLRQLLFLLAILVAAPTAARPTSSPPVPDLPPGGDSTFRRPEVIGWIDGAVPKAPAGFRVERFADGFDSCRWLYVLPNGDVLVTQARTESMGGFPPEVLEALLKQDVFGPSANNIILLRQTPNGLLRTVFLDGLNQPHGMLLHEGFFYVANTDALLRFPYEEGMTSIRAAAEKILDIPAGEEINPWNNHWTRSLVVSPDASKLYLAVGSATDADADGNEHPERAAIWELNVDGSDKRLFATGLRNPVGLAFAPQTGELWTTVNERDGLGAKIPPDYLARVVDGEFYGWPWVYFGTYPDPTQMRLAPNKVAAAKARARVPELALGGHSVPLGLLFYARESFPDRYRQGAFVARRAGVGRADFVGPDVIFAPFERGSPTGVIEPFLTGFIADAERGTVHGRAVGLAVMPDGSLLVSDDGANVIWRVAYAGELPAPNTASRDQP